MHVDRMDLGEAHVATSGLQTAVVPLVGGTGMPRSVRSHFGKLFYILKFFKGLLEDPIFVRSSVGWRHIKSQFWCLSLRKPCRSSQDTFYYRRI